MLAEGWGCHKFTDTGEVVIKAAAGNGSFELSVRDTGPGISVSDQAKLFQEFQQAEKPARRRAPDWGSPYPSASSRCVGDELDRVTARTRFDAFCHPACAGAGASQAVVKLVRADVG